MLFFPIQLTQPSSWNSNNDANGCVINRQGVLPYPAFWVSTKPFGTPIGPYILKWVMTFIMIVAPPAGDAFQFGKSPTVPRKAKYWVILF